MLDRSEFDSLLGIVCESQGWRPLSESLKDLWYSQAFQLEGEPFLRLVMNFTENPGQKPADFFRELRAVVRREFTPPPTPLPPPSLGSDEAIRCRKALAYAAAARSGGTCPYGECTHGGGYGKARCHCFSEGWALPITDEDRAIATNPVAAALGGVPAPDPKEGDLVWR
jgi:hypothetical protein